MILLFPIGISILKKASRVKILKSVIPNIKHDPKINFIFFFFSTKNQVLSMILSNLFFAFITNGASYAQ